MSKSDPEGAVIRESLDVAAIRSNLDALERDARFGDLSDAELSERVTALLSHLRESKGEEPSNSELSIHPGKGWQAARVKDDVTGSETVSCWKEGDSADSEVVMEARWDHGMLVLWCASVGGRMVAEGANLGRRFKLQSSNPSAEITPEPREIADFQARVRREMERFESANATRSTTDWIRVSNLASERDGPPPGMSPDSKTTGEIQLADEANRLLDDLSRRVGGAVIGAVTDKVRKQRKCVNCGHAIGKKVRFCPDCGTEQPSAKKADEGQK